MSSPAIPPSEGAPSDQATPPPVDPSVGVKTVAPMTMTGTVTAGVEANCMLLNGYLLIGGPRELIRSGATITVTGRVQKGMMTTCQQGTPFVVDSATAA